MRVVSAPVGARPARCGVVRRVRRCPLGAGLWRGTGRATSHGVSEPARCGLGSVRRTVIRPARCGVVRRVRRCFARCGVVAGHGAGNLARGERTGTVRGGKCSAAGSALRPARCGVVRRVRRRLLGAGRSGHGAGNLARDERPARCGGGKLSAAGPSRRPHGAGNLARDERTGTVRAKPPRAVRRTARRPQGRTRVRAPEQEHTCSSSGASWCSATRSCHPAASGDSASYAARTASSRGSPNSPRSARSVSAWPPCAIGSMSTAPVGSSRRPGPRRSARARCPPTVSVQPRRTVTDERRLRGPEGAVLHPVGDPVEHRGLGVVEPAGVDDAADEVADPVLGEEFAPRGRCVCGVDERRAGASHAERRARRPAGRRRTPVLGAGRVRVRAGPTEALGLPGGRGSVRDQLQVEDRRARSTEHAGDPGAAGRFGLGEPARPAASAAASSGEAKVFTCVAAIAPSCRSRLDSASDRVDERLRQRVPRPGRRSAQHERPRQPPGHRHHDEVRRQHHPAERRHDGHPPRPARSSRTSCSSRGRGGRTGTAARRARAAAGSGARTRRHPRPDRPRAGRRGSVRGGRQRMVPPDHGGHLVLGDDHASWRQRGRVDEHGGVDRPASSHSGISSSSPS